MASQSLVGLLIFMVGITIATSQSQYHTSDPQGNFKVSYRTSDGQYLVEDRSADGTSLLGNFGYRSSGGEQVGVAYGSDGAGFVIRSPSAAPSTYRRTQVQQTQQTQQPVASQPQVTSTGHDAFLNFQGVSHPTPTSSRAPSSEARPSSTRTQTPVSDLSQHDAGQSFISYYNAATPQYYTPPHVYQPPTLPTYSSINYVATPEAAKSPFTYSFSSYNDPYYNPQYISSQQYVQAVPQYVQPRPQYVQPQRSFYQPLPTVATDLRTVIEQTIAHQRQFHNGPSVNSYYGNLVRPYYL